MKKNSGYTRIVLFGLLFMVPLYIVSFELQNNQYTATSINTEDALAASNLASAVVDIEEYGKTKNLIISDSRNAYEIYKEALKINLGLDDNWECSNKKMISGKVEVVDYIVYNVSGNDVEVCCYGANEYETYIVDGLGSVTAPNGQEIETTSIYSKITFPVEGVWDIHTIAEKEKLVDIINNG